MRQRAFEGTEVAQEEDAGVAPNMDEVERISAIGERLTLSLKDFQRADWFLDCQLGSFDGEDLSLWGGFFEDFEEILASRGWDELPIRMQFELLMCRMAGSAKAKLGEWVRVEPEIKLDLGGIQVDFPQQFAGFKDPWEQLIDFHNLRMKPGEDVGSFAARYLELHKAVEEDGRDAVKFFALPLAFREKMVQGSGDMPRCLRGIIDFTKKTVMKDKAIGVALARRALAVRTDDEVRIIFAGSLLTGRAAKWYRQLELGRSAALGDWDKFTELMMKEFAAKRSIWQVRTKLATIQQGSDDIHSYTARLRSLADEAKFCDEALATIYFLGLAAHIRRPLQQLSSMPSTFDELMCACVTLKEFFKNVHQI